MPHPALIDAVRRKTAETAAAVWSDAHAEADRCRDSAHHAVEERRAQRESQLREISAVATRIAVADAERQSRAIRAAARSAVAERLIVLSRLAVANLRDTTYAERFRSLVNELPRRQWLRVVVNPADAQVARAHFAGVEIATDATITGGFTAESPALRVTNTFEQRLATAWPDLQPAVVKDVIEQHQRARPVA